VTHFYYFGGVNNAALFLVNGIAMSGLNGGVLAYIFKKGKSNIGYP